MEKIGGYGEARVPVFVGHSGQGLSSRKKVGEIVEPTLRQSGNRAEVYTAIELTDPKAIEAVKSGELDSVSIEAELELIRDEKKRDWEVNSVRKVTGVALADSRKGFPGFKDAKIIGPIMEMSGGSSNSSDGRGDAVAEAMLAAEETLSGLNLMEAERRFVMQNVVRSLGSLPPDEDVSQRVKDEMSARIDELDELKKLYRRPASYVSAPLERPMHKAPRNFKDYLDPEINELIPR